MQQKKVQDDKTNSSAGSRYTGPGHGPQGVDKAPGEEENTDNVQFVQETQKGAAKEDGDPSKQEDRAADENI